VKLPGRPVGLVPREVEGALSAAPWLLARGVRAVPARRCGPARPRRRPGPVLLALGDVMGGRIGMGRRGRFRQRLAQARLAAACQLQAVATGESPHQDEEGNRVADSTLTTNRVRDRSMALTDIIPDAGNPGGQGPGMLKS